MSPASRAMYLAEMKNRDKRYPAAVGLIQYYADEDHSMSNAERLASIREVLEILAESQKS